MSAPTPAPEPRRPATAREIFAALPGLLLDPYIPEVHGDEPPRTIAALDVPLDVLEARIAEQHHQVDEDPVFEDRFAHLAIDHPDRCTRDDNWQPGGDR